MGFNIFWAYILSKNGNLFLFGSEFSGFLIPVPGCGRGSLCRLPGWHPRSWRAPGAFVGPWKSHRPGHTVLSFWGLSVQIMDGFCSKKKVVVFQKCHFWITAYILSTWQQKKLPASWGENLGRFFINIPEVFKYVWQQNDGDTADFPIFKSVGQKFLQWKLMALGQRWSKSLGKMWHILVVRKKNMGLWYWVPRQWLDFGDLLAKTLHKYLSSHLGLIHNTCI